jgi:serine/threonine-protein kinase RsbW
VGFSGPPAYARESKREGPEREGALAVQRAGTGPDWDDGSKSELPALTTLSQSLPATVDNVGRLRRVVAHFARRHGASERSIETVSLAVSEALTNVVVHAYRDAPEPGPVLIVAVVRERMLIVTVADEGCGMTPRSDSPGLGLGLGLMAGIADAFEVTPRASGAGVILRMRFALAG